MVALYLQHSRLPELSNKCLNKHLNRTLSELLGLLGLALIAYSMFAFNETTPFPSFWTLLPVIGTALIILAANSQTLVGRLLGMRMLVGIGLLSYSAYLWHQPLFAFARIRLFEGVPVWAYWSLIILTFTLAWLTWMAIEVPTRKHLKLPRLQVLSIAVAGCLVVGVVGGLGWANQGHTSRNAAPSELAAWKDSTSPYRRNCNNPDSPEDTCVIGDGSQPPIYVWGDSHGVELAWQLSERLQPAMHPVKPYTHSGCQPTVGIRRKGAEECPESNAEFFRYLTEEAIPSTVVLVARWPLNTDGSRFNNREGGLEQGGDATVFPDGWNSGSNEERIDQVGQAINRTVTGLIQAGHQVILVYPIPEVGWDVPTHLARTALLKGEVSKTLSTSHKVYRERSATARANLDTITDNGNLLRIRPAQLFCDSFIHDRCIAQLPDGRPLYFDDDHPNKLGARMIADEILRSMREKGWLMSQNIAH